MSAASQLKDQQLIDNMPEVATHCHHCGEPCEEAEVYLEDKKFCCEGCKTVFEILNDNGLCRYYDLDENAGISLKGKAQEEYAFLNDPDVREKIIDFSDAHRTRVTFFMPQIHCASCIWLLENLYKLSPGVLASTVNFVKKEAYITFSEEEVSLRRVVELLASIGYAPAINLSNLDQADKPLTDRSFYYKLGIAGFAFGNIMLLSFPEYLGLDQGTDAYFVRVFGYLNILLALPVVFYSGRDYLQSAWLGLQQRMLNIDVPISIGILTLFGRSVFEILTHTGAGYLDSLAGLVFFLLIGKWFQQRTYHNLSFERDYKSYFPIAAHRKEEGEVRSVTLDKLEAGDIILVKHRELIPADSILLKGDAEIDYSFVTGESEPVKKHTGEKLFAGGRQMGGTIELSLTRRVSQSYLTELWNDEAFTKRRESHTSALADKVGKRFTLAILLVAFSTLAYWLPRDTSIAINAFTAVLIIACPCAVALAIPFIFGNAVRILGRHQFYLKNTAVIEALTDTQAVVFDKTGTLTQRGRGDIQFDGEPLDAHEKQMIRAVLNPSGHPISQQLAAFLQEGEPDLDDNIYQPSDWKEQVGKGVEGIICQRRIKVGSRKFVDHFLNGQCPDEEGVYVQVNHEVRGCFKVNNHFREGIWNVARYFGEKASIFLLSGDNSRERPLLAPIFGDNGNMHFQQSPQDKLQFVRELQSKNQKVLMLGDGLNDAGALKQSDAGIVVAEDTNNFTPACDAILDARQFHLLPSFLGFARRSIRLVYFAYGFALIYNIIGLSFAVQGALSPIVAAILMPLSSISIVLFGMLGSNWVAKRMGL
ncbi:MAG: heavy metal translocating P-type ATPase metal-binding domain-containing protein [Lewinellaceae bacterium]|nr:heavy metal translocating P-type ATPase metal-binding domain-containing protein [Phaeodactylibacter sp.]MCB9040407.1 heavy metal translocating P-type ATPase metal-binding domain-containing protein [Lewinellaceae bacterium]